MHEFRVPIITFLAVVLLGGYIYGELSEIAGHPHIPIIDRPYVMLQLMILEHPDGKTPAEWYLVIFWYALPMIFVFIVGNGVVEFVRLFFDTNEQRWGLALASTYRNHIIVIGLGHVGLRVARTLAQMGFEIVVIDLAPDVDTTEALEALSVPIIRDDARHPTGLLNAGLRHARAVVICTSNDHVNLEVTMRVRDLNPNVRIVTRMWDTQFAQQLKRFLNVEVMSASDLAAPAFAGAAVGIEITQTLTVGDQDFSMIRLKVVPGSFLIGKTIDFLQRDEDADIVLHGRVNEDPIVHPAGDIVVQQHDTIVLFASHKKITDIVGRNRPAIEAAEQ